MYAYDFGKRTDPCGDCWDGHCTMNCGPAIKPKEANHDVAVSEMQRRVRADEAIATISDLKRRLAIAKDQRNAYQKMATMKRKEFELLIELALAVRDMAPPETQRAIDRRINNLENEADNEPNDTKAASEGTTTQS